MYLTVMRRKFIPPLMETFQDILITSVFTLDKRSKNN